MHRSTRAPAQNPPHRRIPWTALSEERDVAGQIWGALAEEHVTRSHIEQFFRDEGLVPCVIEPDIVYAYADGPRVPGSPVQSEWLIEFHFAEGLMTELLVEKRLLGP